MEDPPAAGPAEVLQKAVVLHPDGTRFLALRRARDASARPGRWDLPGGKAEPGETPEDAIRREIEEEAALAVRDLEVVQVVAEAQEGVRRRFVAYRCRALSDRVRLSREHDAYRWLTADAFSALPSAPYLRACVRRAHEGARAAEAEDGRG